jgi:pilus assembly protein CpaE
MLKRVLPRGEQQIQLIVNRFNPANDISLDDVQRTIGLKVYATIGNDYEALIQSINSGKPIVLNGTSKYSRDVKALGVKIAGVTLQEKSNGRAGQWLGRMLGKLKRKKSSEAKQ